MFDYLRALFSENAIDSFFFLKVFKIFLNWEGNFLLEVVVVIILKVKSIQFCFVLHEK